MKTSEINRAADSESRPIERTSDRTSSIKPSVRTSDHLANERTFLAWIRTSISVIGLGFVVARFSVWLRQLTAHLDGPNATQVKHSGLSLPMGVGMMVVGGLLAVVAAARYQRVRLAIENAEPSAANQSVTLVTILILVITASMVAYMLATR